MPQPRHNEAFTVRLVLVDFLANAFPETVPVAVPSETCRPAVTILWGLSEWFVDKQLVLHTRVKFIITVVPGCSTIHQHGQGFRSIPGCVSTSLLSLCCCAVL